MMRRRVVIPALVLTTLGAWPGAAVAQYSDPKPPVADATQRFTETQIDNLAGPVALYPDALLAQVLVAATFPDQVQDAADFVRAYGTDSIDVQSWDISVKAVAHYPSALNAMADKIDWTAALGKAYATQSSDVMASVQRLRRMADSQGNLKTTEQQKIVTTNNTYQIVPVEPRVIYVPVYDPYVIYSRPIFNIGFTSRYWSWGVGFPIGSWLIYDCDWGLRRVYYNGWSPSYYAFGGGWRQRSRPYIQVTNIYVNPRYTNVYVNRSISSRSINYYNVDRHVSVHNGRYFDSRRDGRYDPRDDGRNGTRYAVRNDGNNGSGAVNGGGYRSGNQNATQSPNRGNGNDRGYGNDRGNGSDRANTPRDGSGYGGNNDRGNTGNTGVNNGGNRPGDGNRDGNGNTIRGGRDDSPRDGNGNRVGNPTARPPEQRRSEPVFRDNPQVVMPQRRGETRQPSAQPAPAPEQRRAEPAQRRSEPVQGVERSRGPQQQPQATQSPPPQSAPPASDVRTARRRGG